MIASALSRMTVRIALLTIAAAVPASVSALSDPNDFCTGDPCQISSNETADHGIVLDFGARAVELSAVLTIGDDPMTNSPGSLTIRARSFSIIGTGQVKGAGGTDPGGQITIETTGNIRIDDTRATGAFRLPGTDGGKVTLTAGGRVFGAGRFNLDRDSITAAGGELVINAGGNINLSGDIIAEGAVQGFGGTVDISTNGNLTLSGELRLRGGESGGGSLDLFSVGDMQLGEIDISAGGEFGDAGIADILSLGNLTMTGTLTGNGADNGENCGDAADIDITTDGDINISAPFTMKGRGLDCSGGFLAIDGNAVQITGQLDLSSDGTEGVGGDIDISSVEAMLITGNLRINGPDGAGDLLITSDSDMSIGGDIFANANGTFGSGASLVELDSTGTLIVSGDIIASGGSLGSGGDISLDGCTVIQGSTSTIDARATGGQIGILASDSITLLGTFFGEPTSSPAIDIRYGPAAAPPNVGGATFNVPPNLFESSVLPPCPLCDSALECDDGNACTDNVCDPATGCSNPANSAPCDDGNACTSGDVCASGACLPGTPTVCDDGDVCTDDSCDSVLGCQVAFNTAPCDDSDACTDNDTCSAGTCAGGPVDCEDGNACTDNTCDSALGCQVAFNSAPCDDLDSCTENDICAAGACAGNPIDCEDGNPCTDDVCSAGSCQSTNNTAVCDDGDACTTADTCSGGSCLGGPPPSCGDTDPCTDDSCDSVLGCVNDPIVGCFDSDGDGLVDDEDVCTTLEWSTSPTTPPDQHPSKMRLILKKLSAPVGEQSIIFKGFFNVADPAQPLAPEIDGMHFSLSDASGVIYDIDVPGGVVGEPGNCGSRDGWKVSQGGKPKWKYNNKSGALPPGCAPGSARGLSGVQLKDVRQASKASLQVKVKIKKGDVDRLPSTPLNRVQANLVLGAEPSPGQASAAAIAGQCAEGVITGTPISSSSPLPFCKVKFRSAALDKVVCKGR